MCISAILLRCLVADGDRMSAQSTIDKQHVVHYRPESVALLSMLHYPSSIPGFTFLLIGCVSIDQSSLNLSNEDTAMVEVRLGLVVRKPRYTIITSLRPTGKANT